MGVCAHACMLCLYVCLHTVPIGAIGGWIPGIVVTNIVNCHVGKRIEPRSLEELPALSHLSSFIISFFVMCTLYCFL